MTDSGKIAFSSDFFGRLQNMSYICDMEGVELVYVIPKLNKKMEKSEMNGKLDE